MRVSVFRHGGLFMEVELDALTEKVEKRNQVLERTYALE